MNDVSEFVGFSVLCFPFTLIASWIVYLALRKLNWPRTTTILVSCGLVLVISYVLEMQGRNWVPPPDNHTQIYEVVNGILAALVGLLFWGKKRRKDEPRDPPTKNSES